MKKTNDLGLVNAILTQKYCDAHIHFERMSEDLLKKDKERDGSGYIPEYFDPEIFCYVDIMDRPQQILASSQYDDWLGEVSLISFFINLNLAFQR